MKYCLKRKPGFKGEKIELTTRQREEDKDRKNKEQELKQKKNLPRKRTNKKT
jgi:hypothetical protein